MAKTTPHEAGQVPAPSDALSTNKRCDSVRYAVTSYSEIISPDPPSSAGKFFSLGSPSRIGSTVSA